MNLLITGASGFIGKILCKKLVKQGFHLSILTRDLNQHFPFPCEKYLWLENSTPEMSLAHLEKIRGIINLCGHNINQRWTQKNKEKFYSSRITRTKELLETFKEVKLDFYIGASAIGYYKEGLNLDERSPCGSDFLSHLCKDWEEAHRDFEKISHRVVIFRFPAVLGLQGGVLKYLNPFLKYHLLGSIGKGQFWFSWIEVSELVEIISWASSYKDLEGTFNALSPYPVRFKDFIKALCLVTKKRQAPFIPYFLFSLIFGLQRASSMTKSQYILNDKLQKAGYVFKYPHLKQALEAIYK